MKGHLNYGKSFELWRAHCPQAWIDYTQHEFVKGIENGTLPWASFLDYLRQDYIFLRHFARAWALAVVKADDLVEMKAAANTVNALINDEINLHVKVCGEAGISKEALLSTREKPQNLAYTRFVLEVGYTGTFVDLMAVLAPCVMGYGEIGYRLIRSATSKVYHDWISAYGEQSYQTLCHEVGILIDRSLVLRFGEDVYSTRLWQGLCSKFEIATQLEAGFWEMGLNP